MPTTSDLPTDSIGKFDSEFIAFCGEKYPDLEHSLSKELKISDELQSKLTKATQQFKDQFKL